MTKTLAISKQGSRIVQAAITHGRSEDVSNIAQQLQGSIVDLYKNPNGNHVVTKTIEVHPPRSLRFIIDELLQDSVWKVARHQYGCRILERLLEHWESKDVEPLVEKLLDDPEPLCRHQFSNFVMQHIFEHGAEVWKDRIIEHIVGVLPDLCKHRTASHVVQRALAFGGEKIQSKLVLTLVHAEGKTSLVEIACSRYGSYVIEELASIQAHREVVFELLQNGVHQLESDPYGKRLISKFGLKTQMP